MIELSAIKNSKIRNFLMFRLWILGILDFIKLPLWVVGQYPIKGKQKWGEVYQDFAALSWPNLPAITMVEMYRNILPIFLGLAQRGFSNPCSTLHRGLTPLEWKLRGRVGKTLSFNPWPTNMTHHDLPPWPGWRAQPRTIQYARLTRCEANLLNSIAYE